MRTYFNIIALFSVILFSSNGIAQTFTENTLHLTGSLNCDSKILLKNYSKLQSNPFADDLPGKKSPVLSGVLSAIIPGAGQVYNEDWWIAGIFLAAEVALIATAITYDNKGDDQTEMFEGFADEKWSVVKYAEYLISRGATVEINYDPSLNPWEQIVSWSQLNEAERQFAQPGTHTLPAHGEQQYYELIGKYHQYIPGWPGENTTSNPPQIMLDYSQMRGQANDYYSTASSAVVGIYINHLLSAAEAVWGANRFNKNLSVSLRVQNSFLANRNELVPTLFLRYSF